MSYDDPAITAFFVAMFYGAATGLIIGGAHRLLLLFAERR